MSYRKPLNLTLLYGGPFTLFIVGLILVLVVWNIQKHRQEQIAELTATAKAITELYRQDPGLITSQTNTKVHIQVLNTLPQALKPYTTENYSFIEKKGKRLFRFTEKIAPNKFIVLDIPMNLSDRIHNNKVKREIFSLLMIGAISVVFVFFTTWRLSKRISSGINREFEENRLKALIELAGATAHELRQPMTVLIGYSELLKNTESEEQRDEILNIIKEQCFRMDDIIKKMFRITHYRTIEYTDGVRILDLHCQVGPHSSKN